MAEAHGRANKLRRLERFRRAAPHLSGLQCFDSELALEDRLVEQGFVPSGKRSANVVAQRVAAGNQPTRRAVPTLLPEGLGPENHLSLSLKLVHPFALPVPLPEHCRYACAKRIELGDRLAFTREGSVNLVEALGRACSSTNALAFRACHWMLLPV